MQRGTLAKTHDGKPGLPRGRNRLPAPDVRASQVRRLRGATIAAVAESGYAPVTVADIVRRARVSRAAFYAHFADKEDCFLAATREGGKLMADRVVAATRALPAAPRRDRAAHRLPRVPRVPGHRARLRPGLLHRHADRGPPHPRAVRRGLPSVRRDDRDVAPAGARPAPGLRAVPHVAYLGLAGATAELVRYWVRNGETSGLPKLEDPLGVTALGRAGGLPLAGRRDLRGSLPYPAQLDMPLEQVAGDGAALDLVGALVDPQQP